MKKGRVIYVLLFGCLLSPRISAQEMPRKYAEVLSFLGKTGDYKDNVLKVNLPRNDISVSVAGRPMPTPFGFGGWVAMTKGDGGMEVMMGDLVLLQDEVNPIMSELLENGLEVTALHNHFFWEEPRVFYMHVHGHGTAIELARKLKPAMDLMGNKEVATSSNNAPAGNLDTDRLASIVGHKGDKMGAVYKITIGRTDVALKEMGAVMNARMGLNTWAAFAGSDKDAAVAGDIAMLESEVTPVLKALRRNGLNVVAIHHHMISSRPVIIFLHYWGVGPAEKLAQGFRAAIDELGSSAHSHRPEH